MKVFRGIVGTVLGLTFAALLVLGAPPVAQAVTITYFQGEITKNTWTGTTYGPTAVSGRVTSTSDATIFIYVTGVGIASSVGEVNLSWARRAINSSCKWDYPGVPNWSINYITCRLYN